MLVLVTQILVSNLELVYHAIGLTQHGLACRRIFGVAHQRLQAAEEILQGRRDVIGRACKHVVELRNLIVTRTQTAALALRRTQLVGDKGVIFTLNAGDINAIAHPTARTKRTVGCSQHRRLTGVASDVIAGDIVTGGIQRRLCGAQPAHRAVN